MQLSKDSWDKRFGFLPRRRPLTMRAFRRFLRQLWYRKLFAFVKQQEQIIWDNLQHLSMPVTLNLFSLTDQWRIAGSNR